MTTRIDSSLTEHRHLLQRLETRAEDRMQQLLEADKRIAQFHDGSRIEPRTYRRHLLEDVLRIRLNNGIDALALSTMIERDPTAQLLLGYLHEEYGHDNLLAVDLQTMGLTPAEIEDARPLFSTELLMAYLEYAIRREGPLVAIVWDWLVEWYSARFNATITDGAEAVVGSAAVEQTRKHLAIDKDLEHESAIGQALSLMLVRGRCIEQAEMYVDRLLHLLASYYAELYETSDAE